MAQPTIEAQLQTFIIDEFLFGQATDLAPEDSLLERGIIDSTGMLELVNFLEETFQISLDESELVRDNLDSIAKIAAFVRSKKQTATSAPTATRVEPALANEALCAAAGGAPAAELAAAAPLSAGQTRSGPSEPPR